MSATIEAMTPGPDPEAEAMRVAVAALEAVPSMGGRRRVTRYLSARYDPALDSYELLSHDLLNWIYPRVAAAGDGWEELKEVLERYPDTAALIKLPVAPAAQTRPFHIGYFRRGMSKIHARAHYTSGYQAHLDSFELTPQVLTEQDASMLLCRTHGEAIDDLIRVEDPRAEELCRGCAARIAELEAEARDVGWTT